MTPSEIRKEALRVLRVARGVLMSADYYEALRLLPPAERRLAPKLLFRVDQAIVRLGNSQLADIRDQLAANEDALKDATEAMEEAVEDLEDLAAMFSTIGRVLGIVGRIVTLFG